MNELICMTAQDAPVRAMAITGRDIVERARDIHNTSPTATAALGRTLLGTALLGKMLKEADGSVTVRVKGGGPAGTICCVADSGGNPRGYMQNPQADVPSKYPGKLDVGGLVGNDGFLTIIRDMRLKEPYVGSTALRSGEIAEDFAAYFAESEQIPSVCALGVLVGTDHAVQAAGGFLIQLLPGAAEDVITAVEQGVAALGPVTAALMGGMDAEALLRAALPGFELTLLERTEVAYRCDCNRLRVNRALIALGQDELRALIDEQDGAELTCQFCDLIYHYSSDELEEILKQAK